jgi:O-antigen/teichoic acid export membrane protein
MLGDIILALLELLFTVLLIYAISLFGEHASLIAVSGIIIVFFGSILTIIYQKKHGKKL